jgi:transposase-like protein
MHLSSASRWWSWFGPGRKPAELAEEFSVAEQTIRNWVKQTDLYAGKRADGPSTQEKDGGDLQHSVSSISRTRVSVHLDRIRSALSRSGRAAVDGQHR